jgi:Flp pilus assembly pilin Flp
LRLNKLTSPLRIRLWHGDRRAVTALEYGIIASILGLTLVTIFKSLGTTLTTLFSHVGTSI